MTVGLTLITLVWLGSPGVVSLDDEGGGRSERRERSDEGDLDDSRRGAGDDDDGPRKRRSRRARGGADYERGFDRGEQLGDAASDGFLWFCVGFLCSPMFFPFGCLFVNGYACLGAVDSPVPDADMSPEEAEGFMDGYSEEVSDARFYGALTGTGVATGIAAIGVVTTVTALAGIAVLGVLLSG